MTAPVLIVSADDYGLTPGVCTGILRAHEHGVVTSTSVLAVAPAFAPHAAELRDAGLDVGIHFAIVGEDPPLLSAREVPSLVDRHGRFPQSWRAVLRRAATGRIDPADVRRELSAQLEALAAAGLRPTHVDSHQHLHLWPSIGRVVLEVAAAAGIRAVRLVRRRGWSPAALGVRALSRSSEQQARAAGFWFPAATVGVDHAGALEASTLEEELRRAAAGPHDTVELCTHPGEDPDPARARYRWGYRWAEELALLCEPGTRAAIERAGFRLGSFAEAVRG